MGKVRFFQMIAIFAVFLFSITSHAVWRDPLPSWNDGPIKQRIIQFVETVTDKKSNHYVPPEERIATIDNDGTLWVEQPIYTQVIFAIESIKSLAAKHPEWKHQKPFSLILSGNKNALHELSSNDIERIIAITHAGMTVEEFQKMAKSWLMHAKNPRFNHLYMELVYQPMLEVMNYLRENGFKVYIVTGGGQDFVRAFAQSTYQVFPEQVIGTTMKTQYIYQNGQPVLMKTPSILFIDDKKGKPEAIDLFIGRKPIIAFGNSIGDREMLEWTQSGTGERLMLLVHHDDAKREYAYGPTSKVGTFSDDLMKEAKDRHWQVISMAHDWKVIFPFD